MRNEIPTKAGLARAAGFALAAGTIVVATLHFRDAPALLSARREETQAASDRLSGELKRCQVLAAQAKDDAACEAAWAESRRRFFTYRPASRTAVAPDVPPKSSQR